MADRSAGTPRNRQHRQAGSTSATPDPLRGAVVGVVAGLTGSLAMDLAQKALAKLQPSDSGSGEPATEQAADQVMQAATGRPVPQAAKPLAGQAVHYGFGALLGLGYGLAAEYSPRVTNGGGSAFGLASAMLFDEAAVPAAGLGKAPWDAPASTHLYTLASHLVFGTVVEGTRRLIRTTI